MDSSRLNALIQSDLDGELSAAGRAELARLLLQDPEARRLHDEFGRLDRLLRDIPQLDPPEDLRAAILAARGAAARPAPAARPISTWPAWRMAATILAGLVLVGIGYRLRDSTGPQPGLQGSLGAASQPAIPASTAPLDRLSIVADGVEVNATLRRSGNGQLLELALSGQLAYQVTAIFDPAATAYVGNPGEGTSLDASGEVVVESGAGPRDYALEFSSLAPIRLQVRAGERLLGEGRLAATSR